MSVTVPRPDQINWDSLSPDGRWALKHVAQPLLAGADLAEIASETGLERKEITAALERLKAELRSQASTTLEASNANVSFIRPLSLELEATDLELARWSVQARKNRQTLESWLRDVANREAA